MDFAGSFGPVVMLPLEVEYAIQDILVRLFLLSATHDIVEICGGSMSSEPHLSDLSKKSLLKSRSFCSVSVHGKDLWT